MPQLIHASFGMSVICSKLSLLCIKIHLRIATHSETAHHHIPWKPVDHTISTSAKMNLRQTISVSSIMIHACGTCARAQSGRHCAQHRRDELHNSIIIVARHRHTSLPKIYSSVAGCGYESVFMFAAMEERCVGDNVIEMFVQMHFDQTSGWCTSQMRWESERDQHFISTSPSIDHTDFSGSGAQTIAFSLAKPETVRGSWQTENKLIPPLTQTDVCFSFHATQMQTLSRQLNEKWLRLKFVVSSAPLVFLFAFFLWIVFGNYSLALAAWQRRNVAHAHTWRGWIIASFCCSNVEAVYFASVWLKNARNFHFTFS